MFLFKWQRFSGAILCYVYTKIYRNNILNFKLLSFLSKKQEYDNLMLQNKELLHNNQNCNSQLNQEAKNQREAYELQIKYVL